MAIAIRETRIVEVGGKEFTLTALKATSAYKFMSKLQDMGADDIKDYVVESTGMSKDAYETEFSGRGLLNLLNLVREITEFNFSEVFQELVSEEDQPE